MGYTTLGNTQIHANWYTAAEYTAAPVTHYALHSKSGNNLDLFFLNLENT